MTPKVRRVVGAGFLSAFFLASLLYGLYSARALVAGPRIYLLTPRDGDVVSEALVPVEGRAEHISRIALNGRTIFLDDGGVFKEKLLLAYGYNILTIRAYDRFGREEVETLHITYK